MDLKNLTLLSTCVWRVPFPSLKLKMVAFVSPRLTSVFGVQHALFSGKRSLARRRSARYYAVACGASLLETMRHGRALVRAILQDSLGRCEASVAIDATCGRGSDTITLGQLLGPKGRVHAIDVQETAVAETKLRYDAEVAASCSGMAALTAHCASHADLSFLQLHPDGVASVVYNLGWYPGLGANRAIITEVDSTVQSLREATGLLALRGVIIVTAYPGHPGGEEEAGAVERYFADLNPRVWNYNLVRYPNRNAAPVVHICERVK